MKKTLIALALVSLPVAASAEVILYGAVKAGVEYENNSGRAVSGHKEKAFQIVDYGTRIGFKGSEDLGNGLKAIWQIETKASVGNGEVGFGGRDSFIGLEGGFGTVRAGYVSSPLREAVVAQDNWEYDSDILGLSRYTRFAERRTSINYTSPNWGGFELMAQFAPGNNVYKNEDGTKRTTSDKDPVLGLGLGYNNSGFFGRYAVDYHVIENAKDAHVHNLSGGYDANNLYVALGLQYGKNVAPGFAVPAGATKVDVSPALGGSYTPPGGGATVNVPRDGTTKEAQVSAAYTFGAVTPKVSVAYGRADSANANFDGGRYTQVVAGADYAFSRRTTGLVSLGWLSEKGNSNAESAKSWAVGTGIVHKF